VGFLRSLNQLVFGTAPPGLPVGEISVSGLVAMGVSLVLVLGLGLVVPAPLATLVGQAAAVLAGGAQ
jgi:hypothetical protein